MDVKLSPERRAMLGVVARNLVGVLGVGLVVAGVWGLGGWQWGAISAGLPVAAFYLYGEVRAVRGPKEAG